MRNIKVEAKSVDMAIEKGLQMLGLTREEVEVEVISEGSMLKKASVEIYTFADDNERQEYLSGKSKKESVKLVKTNTEEEVVEMSFEGVEEVTEIVTTFLEGLLKQMDIEGTITRGVKNGDVVFKVNGESINNLIGYHGETLEAVQYIVNTIVKDRVPTYRKKVYLDVENYRRKRQETVEALAEKIAKKVLTTKKSIKLEPMNSFERKSIHFALSNIEHIGTHSEGTEPNRYLVIDYID
ncbi:MAG: KH domain-containing protein [Clostridiales bacterium]|nr:KH domain-containing protein [Clostridiales bacterium]